MADQSGKQYVKIIPYICFFIIIFLMHIFIHLLDLQTLFLLCSWVIYLGINCIFSIFYFLIHVSI